MATDSFCNEKNEGSEYIMCLGFLKYVFNCDKVKNNEVQGYIFFTPMSHLGARRSSCKDIPTECESMHMFGSYLWNSPLQPFQPAKKSRWLWLYLCHKQKLCWEWWIGYSGAFHRCGKWSIHPIRLLLISLSHPLMIQVIFKKCNNNNAPKLIVRFGNIRKTHTHSVGSMK